MAHHNWRLANDNVFFFLMANAGSSAYDVDNSAMFNEPDDEYFTRTPSAASNQRTWTFSTWVKRGKLGSDQRIFTAASNGGELFLMQMIS